MKKLHFVPLKNSWTYWLILTILCIFVFFLMFGIDILVTYGDLDVDKVLGTVFGHEITFYDMYFHINLYIWLEFFLGGFVAGFKWCLSHIVHK